MKCEKCGGADLRTVILLRGSSVTCLNASCGHIKTTLFTTPQKDESKEERNNAAYKRWKKAVQKRDNYRCQLNNCGKTEKLETHHIRKWNTDLALRYKPANGVTLCFDCHHSIQDREEQFEEYFDGVVRANAAKDPRLALLLNRHKNKES